MPNFLLKQLYAHKETTVHIITDNYKQLPHVIKQRYVLSCLTRWLTFKQIQPPCRGKNKQQQQQQQPTTDIYHVGNICFGTKSSQLADSQS